MGSPEEIVDNYFSDTAAQIVVINYARRERKIKQLPYWYWPKIILDSQLDLIANMSIQTID
jgi:hypothetical protein